MAAHATSTQMVNAVADCSSTHCFEVLVHALLRSHVHLLWPHLPAIHAHIGGWHKLRRWVLLLVLLLRRCLGVLLSKGWRRALWRVRLCLGMLLKLVLWLLLLLLLLILLLLLLLLWLLLL